MCNPLELAYLAVAQRAGVAPFVASFIGCALYEYAMRQRDRGNVAGFSTAGLAAWSRGITKDEVETVIEAMAAEGMIDDGKLAGMPPRAMTSTERSQRRRARLRAEAATTCNDAPLHNVADVAPVADAAKPLVQHEPRNADATPSRARLKGSENINESIILPDLKQERLHTSKEAREVKNERWLSTTTQYAAKVLAHRDVIALSKALGNLKTQSRDDRPLWLQRDLDRLDAHRRGLELPPALSWSLTLELARLQASEPREPRVQSKQREMMLAIEGGARPPPVPEMLDYRGEGAAPLSAVGD